MIALVSLALAHRPGLSYARLGADQVVLTFAKPELSARVPLDDDLDASRVVVGELTIGAATFTVAGASCEVGDTTIRHVEGDGIEVAAPLDCPPGEVSYTAAFLPKMEAGHRHYVEAAGAPLAVLSAADDTVVWRGAPERSEVATRFLALGVEHIWTGYDHLLFLLGLLVAAPSLRAMLVIVTGFTVAHSITLSAAALGLFTLSPALVEPAIAASIAYVGIENFFRPGPRRRMVITFGLGLIHGFGFAGMLTELGLPRDALALALVCFNGGVELGQAVVVSLALPLLLWMRRFPSWRKVSIVLNAGVAFAGLYWFVERVFSA